MTRSSLRSAFLALAASLALACGSGDLATVAPAPEATAPGPRALVTADGGHRVLLRSGVEAAMAHGPLSMISDEAPLVVRRDGHLEGLTSDELRWLDREVLLLNEHGVVCKAAVDAVEVVGRFHMDDGTRMDWYDEDGRLRIGDQEALERAWELAPSLGSLDLTGRLRVLSGDCDGAVWAQLGEEPAPPVAAAEPASPELREAALEALRGTQAYQEAQASYEEFRAEAPEGMNAGGFPARWEDYNSSVVVTLAAHPGGETLVVTGVQAGEGCGDFLGTAFQVWRMEGGRLEPVASEGLGADASVLGASDVDGDGRVDLVLPWGYVRRTGRGFEEVHSSEIPANLGCGC